VVDIKTTPDFIFLSGTGSDYRTPDGLWVFDKQTKSWFYLPVSTGVLYQAHPSAIFVGTKSQRQLLLGRLEAIDQVLMGAAHSWYQIIYKPDTARKLRLTDIWLNIDVELERAAFNDTLDITMVVRYYDFSKTFLHRDALHVGGTFSTTQFTIEGTYPTPNVGDRVEFFANATINGEIRHITAVSGDAHPIVTVDTALSAAPTASDVVWIMPLQKISSISLSEPIDLEDLHINVLNQPIFQKLMIEVEFQCGANTKAPRLNAIEVEGTIL